MAGSTVNAQSYTRSHCSFTETRTIFDTDITVTVDEAQVHFNIKDISYSRTLEDAIYDNYKTADNEKGLYCCMTIIDIFEKLIIFLYKAAVSLGDQKFQEQVKTAITNTLTTFEKCIPIMQQYKGLFFCMLKKANVKIDHGLFYKGGYKDFAGIFTELSQDAHEKFTGLQTALNEATKLNKYNEYITDSLQETTSLCVEGIELLHTCIQEFSDGARAGRDDLRRELDGNVGIEHIGLWFVVIERCQTLIEKTKSVIQNIKQEICKPITVDMAKNSTRKELGTIAFLKSSLQYHYKVLQEWGSIDFFDFNFSDLRY